MLIFPTGDCVGHEKRRVEMARERFLFGDDSGEKATRHPLIGTLKVFSPCEKPQEQGQEKRKRHPDGRDDLLLLSDNVLGLGLTYVLGLSLAKSEMLCGSCTSSLGFKVLFQPL